MKYENQEYWGHLSSRVDGDGFLHLDGVLVAYVGDPQAVYVNKDGYLEISERHGLEVAAAIAMDAFSMSADAGRVVQ